MNTQQQESQDYEASARYARFDGFDRGDLGRDYTADQNAMNEAEDADEARLAAY